VVQTPGNHVVAVGEAQSNAMAHVQATIRTVEAQPALALGTMSATAATGFMGEQTLTATGQTTNAEIPYATTIQAMSIPTGSAILAHHNAIAEFSNYALRAHGQLQRR
jgi:hypothetical protein